MSQLHVKHEATQLSTRLWVFVLKYYCINHNSQVPYMLCLASAYISFFNETLHTVTPTWTLIGNFSVSTFHTAMCSLMYCWNACYCLYQHGYSSALFIHFGWCEQQMRKQYFSPQNVLLSVPQSALISTVWLHQVQLRCIWGMLVLRLWHLLRNVMTAVCTILTVLHLRDLHPDDLLHPDA